MVVSSIFGELGNLFWFGANAKPSRLCDQCLQMWLVNHDSFSNDGVCTPLKLSPPEIVFPAIEFILKTNGV